MIDPSFPFDTTIGQKEDQLNINNPLRFQLARLCKLKKFSIIPAAGGAHIKLTDRKETQIKKIDMDFPMEQLQKENLSEREEE